MSGTVYVAFDLGGTVSFAENPSLLMLRGGVFISFEATDLVAGILLTDECVSDYGVPTRLMQKIVDELDGAGVPWSDIRDSGSCVRSLNGKIVRVFTLRFSITDPMPHRLAGRVCGNFVDKPDLVNSTRYGA